MSEQPEYKTIHKRAAEIVEKDPILGYAIACAVRKRIVGRDMIDPRHALLDNLVYSAWNSYVEISTKQSDPRYVVRILNLITDTLLIGYNILTDNHNPHANLPRSPSK